MKAFLSFLIVVQSVVLCTGFVYLSQTPSTVIIQQCPVQRFEPAPIKPLGPFPKEFGIKSAGKTKK